MTPHDHFPSAGLHDTRIIAVDMDGTLLDGAGRIPEAFWGILETARAAGVQIVPASGRPLVTLRQMFGRAGDDLYVIAENGAVLARGDTVLAVRELDAGLVPGALDRFRSGIAGTDRSGIVLCGVREAFVEVPLDGGHGHDDEFVRGARRYYAALRSVADLVAVTEAAVKIAVYVADRAEALAASVGELGAHHELVVSGASWVDLSARGVHKGVALAELQRMLGATAAQTMVFGDYLNDLGMLDVAEHSYAMANAHPLLRARARAVAPSNTDHGVIRVLSALFGTG